MTRRSVSLTTYGSTEAPLYYDGKMELRKCEDMSKNGDKMIPLLLAYIFWGTPGPPSNQKKREKINELVHKIEQISLCTSRKERQQHKLLSPHTERQELSLLANQRI